MNLPWDKSYFKLCFYVIFTFICIYIAKNAIDAVVYTFVNIGDIYSFISSVLMKICSVFSIIIVGFIIAFIFKPVVEFVENKVNIKKATSVGVVFLLIIIIGVSVSLFLFYNVNYNQLKNSFKIYSKNIGDIYNSIILFFDKHNLYFLKSIFTNINKVIFENVKGVGENVLIISREIISKAVTFLLSIVTAFYMLRDENKIINRLNIYSDALLSKKLKLKICQLIKDIDFVFSGYLRGQLTDGVIMAGLISLGLAIIKVPFAVPIGLFSGFSNIIPYFGSIIGFLLSVGMAIVSGEPMRAIYAGILIIGLQQLDTVFIVPKIVGESVKLSPVMIITSLAVAGKLFGIVGMIFAVPVVAVIKLRLDKYCDRKLERELRD